jgi:chemotaxis protein CheC
MNDDMLSSDQRDALQEIANIGMGAAASRLALLLDCFVTLSIPRISLVDCAELEREIRELTGECAEVSAFRQSFRADIAGEVMVVFDHPGDHSLREAIYGTDGDASEHGNATSRELLFEIANLLTGACISGLLEQLQRVPTFSVPRVIDASDFVDDVVKPGDAQLTRALLLDINVAVQDSGFTAHLVVLLDERAVEQLRDAIDQFLAAL